MPAENVAHPDNAADGHTVVSSRRFGSGWYLVVVVAAMLASVVYTQRVNGVFACPRGAPEHADYVADCNAVGYGDYDHGAFWFGLEKDALNAASGADVVFLGSSRLQFAFSTPATEQWFADANVSYYLLGFSHTENAIFFASLLDRLKPRARAYVINVDRFFDVRETPPTQQIRTDADARGRYRSKQFWQSLQGTICGVAPRACGDSVAFMRARRNGTWTLLGTAPFVAAAVSDGQDIDVDRWEQFEDLAERFVSALPVPRECVILTIAPYANTKRGEAVAIAKALGLPLRAPQIDGLMTFDGSHLDSASAERWSKAFFQNAGAAIEQCVHPTGTEDRQ